MLSIIPALVLSVILQAPTPQPTVPIAQLPPDFPAFPDNWRELVTSPVAENRLQILVHFLGNKKIKLTIDDQKYLLGIGKSANFSDEVRFDAVRTLFAQMFRNIHVKPSHPIDSDVSSELLKIAEDSSQQTDLRCACVQTLGMCLDGSEHGNKLDVSLLAMLDRDQSEEVVDSLIMYGAFYPIGRESLRFKAIKTLLTSPMRSDESKSKVFEEILSMKMSEILTEDDFQDILEASCRTKGQSDHVRADSLSTVSWSLLYGISKLRPWVSEVACAEFQREDASKELRKQAADLIAETPNDSPAIVQLAWNEAMDASNDMGYRKDCLKIVKTCIISDNDLLEVMSKSSPLK